jgi:hypothetical protein
MAGEFVGYGVAGVAHDFFAFNAANAVWQTTTSTYVTPVDADIANYRITATPGSAIPSKFTGDKPPGATRYELRVRGANFAASTLIWEDKVFPENFGVMAITSAGRMDLGLVNGATFTLEDGVEMTDAQQAALTAIKQSVQAMRRSA